MDRDQLLRKYADNLANSRRKNAYVSAASAFLEETEGLDRGSIDCYLQRLSRRYKPGTVNYRFRVIRRLFAVNGLPWEYRHGEAPVIGERDEHHPQLAPEVVQAS